MSLLLNDARTKRLSYLGLLVALAGVFLVERFGNSVFDGAAIFLVNESRGLLVGEGADPATLAAIRRLANPTRRSNASAVR